MHEQYKQYRDEIFTPLTPDLIKLIELVAQQVGGWDNLSERTGLKTRYFRHLRHGRTSKRFQGYRHKTISFAVLDKTLTAGGLVWVLKELPWYTTEELLEKGMWKKHADFTEIHRRRRDLKSTNTVSE